MPASVQGNPWLSELSPWESSLCFLCVWFCKSNSKVRIRLTGTLFFSSLVLSHVQNSHRLQLPCGSIDANGLCYDPETEQCCNGDCASGKNCICSIESQCCNATTGPPKCYDPTVSNCCPVAPQWDEPGFPAICNLNATCCMGLISQCCDSGYCCTTITAMSIVAAAPHAQMGNVIVHRLRPLPSRSRGPTKPVIYRRR